MNTAEKIAKIEEQKSLKVYETQDIIDGSEKITVKMLVLSKSYKLSDFESKSAEDVIREMNALWDAQNYCGE